MLPELAMFVKIFDNGEHGEYCDGPQTPNWNGIEDFSRELIGDPALRDDRGWNQPFQYDTIQYANLNSYGKEHLIASNTDSIITYCFNETDKKWGRSTLPIAHAGGMYKDPSYYKTIQCADIDGDGIAELILRNKFGVLIYKYIETGNSRRWKILPDDWPLSISQFSNENGWDKSCYYETIQCADINGDGRAELVPRSKDGIVAWNIMTIPL